MFYKTEKVEEMYDNWLFSCQDHIGMLWEIKEIEWNGLILQKE